MTRRQQGRLITTLVAKDWLLFWNDRRAAVLCFLVPIILATAFGVLFHRPQQQQGIRLPMLLVDGSESALAQRVINDLLQSPRVEAEVVSLKEATRRIEERRPGVAVLFPPDFAMLERWEPRSHANRPPLKIMHHPLCDAESQWAEGVMTEAIMRRLAIEKFGSLAESMIEPPFRTEIQPLVGETAIQFNSYSHSFCGMTLQYLLFWGMESGLMFLRERQRGVWLRIRSSPAPLWSIIVAKALSTSLIALLQVLITFGFGYLVFGITITGSWIGFGLIALAACALAATTGLLVAAIGGSESRARNVSILVILSVSMIGGLWLPTFLLPEWARDLALLLPTTWTMRGFEQVVWQGRGLLSVLPNIAVVGAFTLGFLAFAVLRLMSSDNRFRRGETR